MSSFEILETPVQEKITHKSILELDCTEAQHFFLKAESYCKIDFPKYINFSQLLDKVHQALSGKDLQSMRNNPRDYEDVNYTILNNKDGRYAWRPLQLIHPALYVSLVHKITEESTWGLIVNRFHKFRENEKIKCLSLPVKSLSEKTDKEEQVFHWWHEVEQRSIELSLDYEYMLETDLTDCYSSIYTHSIAWALHSKSTAKEKRRDMALIGNIIDGHIQDMSYGQTNGIPQGSVLMDFIAEIVLGFADLELSKLIKLEKIEDYSILRYRDDYRIFVNNPQDGEKIIKSITEVMTDLGLKLNQYKTKSYNNIICSSVKVDKLAWINKKQKDVNIQQQLFIINDFSHQFPNSGSLTRALNSFNARLEQTQNIMHPLPLIAMVVDIAYRNPRVYTIAVAILSHLMKFIEEENSKRNIIEKIKNKFSKIPNTGYMEIWIQRMTLTLDKNISYKESICKLISGDDSIGLWNNNWINSPQLKDAIKSEYMIDEDEIRQLEPVISKVEVDLFSANKSNNYDGY